MTSTDISKVHSTVVGIDGSENSYLATQWAAKWAKSHGTGLTIVMVQPEVMLPRKSHVWKAMLEANYNERQKDKYLARLHKAELQAREVAPAIEVSSILLEGDVAGSLVEITKKSETLILGKRGSGQASIFTLGGVADSVVTNAGGTVITIPHDFRERPGGPVLVGIDDDSRAKQTVRYAFEQADKLGAPLVVMHAWYAPPAASEATMVVLVDADEINEESHAFIQSTVAELAQEYPNVKVTSKVVNANPGDALAAESKNAQLIVVSSRGRGGFTGLLLGSTSRRVVRLSSAPTAVIRCHK
ncbi:universal stress protein [Propionimicrobium lymphophilum]|uniref:universal stress protein n=1 Tax=Propionimicrobium lymphophilum TaxID=33012 RepID=UPI0023F4949A|nr:universal stress protein [Propionimicrobium lymphophilum]